MNINATLFVQLVVFFIGAWITMKFIWPPLRSALDERRSKIEAGLAAADRGARSLDDAQKKIAALEAEARVKAQQIVVETEKRAQLIVDDAKKQAKAEGDRLVMAARAEAEQAMQHVKLALRDEVAKLAVAGAEQILKREVNPQVHAGLLDELKAKL
jgi:F-type H+-transporting ATPase subunit b